MHQTTIRFGSDLWRALSGAAEEQGTSVAQYVREAAVARMAQESAAGGRSREATAGVADTDRRRGAEGSRYASRGAAARSTSRDQVEGSRAVWAQGQQARAQARAVREEAARIRALRPATPEVLARLQDERRRRTVAGSGRGGEASHAHTAPRRA
ncbi:hypothetical protein [Patulibacter americanus]|uniref:hypothetical protein n=1 Tax=Patulibacter americanus TaxID=588672 RepID=UPI0003B4C928|nr:hypothetical protein [Patulibacter americanus]